MSRFLLALKTCFINLKPLDQKTQKDQKHQKDQDLQADLSKPMRANTMVFDEIDTGVSGRVAKAIATQLWQISRSSQVLCVTHQPLIAAIADQHFHVTKQVMGDRTQVQIRLLELAERKQELAQIVSGQVFEEEKKEGKGKKEKGKILVEDSISSSELQAIAFAESLLEQALAIKTSNR
jgi:DNA repair protein RecN (Recombination protein N)